MSAFAVCCVEVSWLMRVVYVWLRAQVFMDTETQFQLNILVRM